MSWVIKVTLIVEVVDWKVLGANRVPSREYGRLWRISIRVSKPYPVGGAGVILSRIRDGSAQSRLMPRQWLLAWQLACPDVQSVAPCFIWRCCLKWRWAASSVSGWLLVWRTRTPPPSIPLPAGERWLPTCVPYPATGQVLTEVTHQRRSSLLYSKVWGWSGPAGWRGGPQASQTRFAATPTRKEGIPPEGLL